MTAAPSDRSAGGKATGSALSFGEGMVPRGGALFIEPDAPHLVDGQLSRRSAAIRPGPAGPLHAPRGGHFTPVSVRAGQD